MLNETSRKTASFWPPLMYSFVTSRAISMNETSVGHEHQLRRIWRAVAIAVLGGIVACGSGSAANVQSVQRTTESKNNMGAMKSSAVRAETAQREASTARTPVVLFFGTSLTAGYGLNPDQAFPALIEQKARTEGLPIKAVNAGLSGETTAGG